MNTQMKWIVVALGVAALLMALPGAWTVPTAQAATIVVDGTTCTLVDAILAAETDSAQGGCVAGSGADVIDLQTDVTLNTVYADYNGLTGLPEVTTTVTIEGNGRTLQRDTGGPELRFLSVDASGNLTLRNLTVQNGVLTGPSGGGAIYNNGGTLTVTGSTFSGNSAGDGGAIYNNGGTLTVTGSTFSGNSATLGGAIYNLVTAIVTDSTFSGNSATEGGAIKNYGTLTVTGSTFTNNSGGVGGAINDTSMLTVTGSTFTNNSADLGGAIESRGMVTVTNSTFTNNSGDDGGAINNAFTGVLGISGSYFEGNSAQSGGAVFSRNNVTIDATVFSGNDDEHVLITNSATDVTLQNVCFQGSDTAIELAGGLPVTVNATNNWWGTPSGPNVDGAGPGDGLAVITNGGSIDISGFKTSPTGAGCVPAVATVTNDFYGVAVGVPLTANVTDNDVNVVPGSVALVPGAEPLYDPGFTLNPDGSFTYTADPTLAVTVTDGFRYQVRDSAGADIQGLVCIGLSNLQLRVPPTQNTEPGSRIVFAPPNDVQVISNAGNDPVVQVRLKVTQGRLDVNSSLIQDGAVELTPAEECEQLNAQVNAQPPPPPDKVVADGRGTGTLELSGKLSLVNQVLDTLFYDADANASGADTLVIIANSDETGGGFVFGSVAIIFGLDRGPGVRGGGDSGPIMANVPLGPATLFELSQLPNTVITGEPQTDTIPNGDVWVRVFVANGNLHAGTEQIGDPFLLELDLLQAADLYGQTAGGAAVVPFTAPIKVCLRGAGTFYFRDAAMMPRATRQLTAFTEGAFTCAPVPNAGVVVLVAGGAAPAANVPVADDSERRPVPDGCMVTTDAIINLREGPGTDAPIIRRIPFDVTLTAFETTGTWFYVDYLGLRGWMSADFVTPNGAC